MTCCKVAAVTGKERPPDTNHKLFSNLKISKKPKNWRKTQEDTTGETGGTSKGEVDDKAKGDEAGSHDKLNAMM